MSKQLDLFQANSEKRIERIAKQIEDLQVELKETLQDCYVPELYMFEEDYEPDIDDCPYQKAEFLKEEIRRLKALREGIINAKGE